MPVFSGAFLSIIYYIYYILYFKYSICLMVFELMITKALAICHYFILTFKYFYNDDLAKDDIIPLQCEDGAGISSGQTELCEMDNLKVNMP